MPTPPPDRVVSPRGLLLRVREDDVAQVIEAAAANADHLGAFIPWGADPAYRAERIGAAPADWAGHLAYLYAFRESADGPVLGGFSLHRRVGPDGLEIGYWLAASHTGRGLATELAGALTGVALGLPEIARVEIHTDEGNTRSAAVPQRLGYHLTRVDEFEPRTRAETGRLQIWVIP
ncbi:GNAT family N-acetyltransferase [Propionicimonas sp.]|uniref:GNAT family N-acetyltransferase n=1 Tax=Propionicimonas sp. TaxID=1955623 RepID=UPI0039E7043E